MKFPEQALAQIDATRQRITEWRATRLRLSPMPGELWRSAVELARTYGVSPIARALSLDHASLRKRLGETASTKLNTKNVATEQPQQFVELPMSAQPFGAGLPVVALALSDGSGARLELQLGSVAAPDVVRIAQAIWSTRR
jgi:hypothetical protein